MSHFEPFPFDFPSLVHTAIGVPVEPKMFKPATTDDAQPQLRLGGVDCGWVLVAGDSVVLGPFPPEYEHTDHYHYNSDLLLDFFSVLFVLSTLVHLLEYFGIDINRFATLFFR